MDLPLSEVTEVQPCLGAEGEMKELCASSQPREPLSVKSLWLINAELHP